MAKDAKKQKTDYAAELRALKAEGPGRLYLLWGEEDYLRECFLEELKRRCGVSQSDFNYHRLSVSPSDIRELQEAVDAVPFMGERTFIELRDFDLNACRDETAEKLSALLSDIPDYATVAILLPLGYEPDGRLAVIKSIKKLGSALEFTAQPQSLLFNWITRRFESMGKSIGRAECERLIFTSGELMTGLIPEIEKIGSYAKGESVTAEDIDKLAQRIPEASVFEMTDRLAERRFDEAAALLAELLQSGEHPIKLLAMIGFQLRRLYAARLALDEKLGRDYVMECCKISYPYLADKLLSSARGFSAEQLANAIELCAQADYRMKSSSEDDEDILKELLLRVAVGEKR